MRPVAYLATLTAALNMWAAPVAAATAATAAVAPKKEEAALISAAVVYNIARFSTWPAEAVPGTPFFEICHDAEEHLSDAFATIAGKEVAGRPIRPVAIVDGGDIRTCHVYFTTRKSDEAFLHAMAERGALTIGEDSKFLERGGAVRLTIKGKPRFSVNVGNAHAAGVQPSSKLLRLAEEVVE